MTPSPKKGLRKMFVNVSGRYPYHPRPGADRGGAGPRVVMKPPCWAGVQKDCGKVVAVDMPYGEDWYREYGIRESQ